VTAKASDRAKIAEAAEKYVKAGKLVAAIVEYEKLLVSGVRDLPISNIIGDLHLRHGDDDKAIRIFTANLQALDRRGAYAQALAIAKKIQKIRPHDFENIIRMGDLYSHLGFVAEARSEYLKAGEELERRREFDPLLVLYEKLARIDRSDLGVRLRLARLYTQKPQMDKAVKELNDVADLLYVRNEFAEAEKVLREALALKVGQSRTMSNLVRIFAKAGKRKEAIALVEQKLEQQGESVELLTILANLHFEARHDDKAAGLFSRILAEDPHHPDARAKLGSIEIRRGRLDEAYAVFEPLIFSLLNKNKEDKAVGLLGLILMSGTMPPPALERLATIFRIGARRAQLEVVDRVLLAEYRRRRLDDDRARVVRELMELSPSDPEIEREFKALHWEAKVFAEESARPAGAAASSPAVAGPILPAVMSDEERDIIRLNLAKADLYIGQGLVRNARRILDNLLLLYPDDPRITAKIKELQDGRPSAGRDDIALIIEQIAAGAAAAEAGAAPAGDRILPPFDLGTSAAPPHEVKLTAADLFAGLDLSPFGAPKAAPSPSSRFLSLGDKVQEELEAIQAAFFEQIEHRTAVIEKGLTEIVQAFRDQVEIKLDRKSAETRYSLGLAFLEQRLYDEAVEEFKLAADDPERTADCFGLIAQSFIKQNNRPEGRRWLEWALEKAPPGSSEFYALTYELALLLESLGEDAPALAMFQEVQRWNAKYRDTAKRIRVLQKSRSV
jgi:tetratricopeptide (TPR) repeat protein